MALISDVVNREYESVGQGNVKALRRMAVAGGKADYGLTDMMKAENPSSSAKSETSSDSSVEL